MWSDRSRGGNKEGARRKEEKERIRGRGEGKDITRVRGDAACLFSRGSALDGLVHALDGEERGRVEGGDGRGVWG